MLTLEEMFNLTEFICSRFVVKTEKSLQTVQGAAILLTYTVTTTSIYSQTQLWNELSAGVSSGQFNTQLWVVANTNGATVMEGENGFVQCFVVECWYVVVCCAMLCVDHFPDSSAFIRSLC